MQRQPLLVQLDESGQFKSLSVKSVGLNPRYRHWEEQAENFDLANAAALSCLDIKSELAASRSGIVVRLKPGGIVGAAPLFAPDTRKVIGRVIVRPRFGWRGIGSLLVRTGWRTRPSLLRLPTVPGSALQIPPWVLAGPLVERLQRLLSETRRGFHLQTEPRSTPRGRIRWAQYVAQQIPRGRPHRLPCEFPDLGPDELLRSYLRWGFEAVYRSVYRSGAEDPISHDIARNTLRALTALADVQSRRPETSSINRFLAHSPNLTPALQQGLEGLRWIVDERGLAGTARNDGLSWALPMHFVFESWTEAVCRAWANGFGGQVRSAIRDQTTVPLHWLNFVRGSITRLIPGILVHSASRLFVIDAKYKGLFQDLDQDRWNDMAQELQEGHRHDVHQVLAYASMFDAPIISAVLVYPMRFTTWSRLAKRNRTVVSARILSGDRTLTLSLVGIPLDWGPEHGFHTICQTFDALWMDAF